MATILSLLGVKDERYLHFASTIYGFRFSLGSFVRIGRLRVPIQRTSNDIYADREGRLKSSVQEFRMGHDVDLLTICPVGHLEWVTVLLMAFN